MSEGKDINLRALFVAAKDLMVVVKFENDDSSEGMMRAKLAKEIVCQLILLGQKRGRPARFKENVDEAA